MDIIQQPNNEEEKKRSIYLHSGNRDSIATYIINKVSTIQRIEKGKVQVIILTCSRERAFFLFSLICQRIQNTPLVCHATVGSLRFERDLKALNYGVDILIITPGRIKRLYDRNENCFDSLITLYVDEAEILFTRGMINRTKECCELFKTPELHFFYDPTITECKVCNYDEVHTQIQKIFSTNAIEDTIQESQESQKSQEIQEIHIPSSTYTLLPETDSISIPKRIAYILYQINTLFTDPAIRLICIHSFSEYNINYLLSFLIEHKDMIIPSSHLICFSETNIHKEIRSRLSFIHQAAKNPSTYVICLIHDCLLPIFNKYQLFQAQLHIDVPLSEQILQSRLKLLQTENCHFYLTATQLQVMKMLFMKYKVSLQAIHLPNIDKEKRVVEEYIKKKKENQNTVIPKEEVQLEELSEKEIHSLFYQNNESEIVEPGENQNFIELDLKNLDADGLENLDEELEKLENPIENPSTQQNSSFQSFQSFQTPMIPQNSLFSVFNPFYNPGVLHCNSNQYSSF